MILTITLLSQNHRIERHWVEVNSRINFPLKRALTNMQQQNLIDMDCPVTKYCVSVVTGKLARVGIEAHIASWNNHRIPGIVVVLLVVSLPISVEGFGHHYLISLNLNSSSRKSLELQVCIALLTRRV